MCLRGTNSDSVGTFDSDSIRLFDSDSVGAFDSDSVGAFSKISVHAFWKWLPVFLCWLQRMFKVFAFVLLQREFSYLRISLGMARYELVIILFAAVGYLIPQVVQLLYLLMCLTGLLSLTV